jgi:Fe-S-cluster containining protein
VEPALLQVSGTEIPEAGGRILKSQPFYRGGLRFSCRRCSICCRHEPGFVFLSAPDVKQLAKSLEMEYTVFVQSYCRWVPSPGGGVQLSLVEKANYDCIFWDEGCNVYENRPLQCRTFPFWDSAVYSDTAWNSTGCPGINRGELHGREYIEACLVRRKAEPVLAGGVS